MNKYKFKELCSKMENLREKENERIIRQNERKREK